MSRYAGVEMNREGRTPSVKDRVDFLQAVASGKRTEIQKFKDWFPDLSHKNLQSLPKYARWRMESTVWKSPNVRPSSKPMNDRAIYEEMLRHQLRVIWHRAITGDSPKAPATRLLSEVREFQHLIRRAKGDTEPGPDVAVWCKKTECALKWLEHNTHKLRLCAITNCTQFPYFIVTKYRKKYCSDYCQEVAEVEYAVERAREQAEEKKAALLSGQGSKTHNVSPKGRVRIREAVKARWNKYRMKMKRSKNT
jgi:hypothetical protein